MKRAAAESRKSPFYTLPLTLHIRPRISMVMPRLKTTSLRRTKKNRFAPDARVLVMMPGVTGVVTHVGDEPGMFGEYMHTIKTEHGERHEPGSNLELIPKPITNAESESVPASSTHIHIG